MQRIVILGCAGSGKTTLARQIGERLGVPVVCLDAIWQPQWTQDDIPRFRSLTKEMHAGERWISDGNFAAATFDIRLPRATLVIWLDRSRVSCVRRAITRVFQQNETHRFAGLANVLAFIWQFERLNRPKIEKNRIAYGAKVPVRRLANNREIAAFLASAGMSRGNALH